MLVVNELLAALRATGIDDDLAVKAAAAVMGHEERTDLVTKADLAEFKVEILRALNRHMAFMLAAMIALTGIFATIVKL